MNWIVDRVIKAMVATECDCAQWSREPLEEIARAAIMAMREPTSAMEHAGAAVRIKAPETIWKAMIDEALRK